MHIRIFELKPIFVDTIPNQLEDGVLYISYEYGCAIHLCACGCKRKTVTDLQPNWKGGWTIQENYGKITLRPSIGNFSGENPYHAHYYISENKIEWL